jgi:hypothetical protein
VRLSTRPRAQVVANSALLATWAAFVTTQGGDAHQVVRKSACGPRITTIVTTGCLNGTDTPRDFSSTAP